MDKVVKVQEAKTHLSALIGEVERGAEVVIARGNTPVARLVPLQDRGRRELGFVAWQVPASFFDDLSADELAAWES